MKKVLAMGLVLAISGVAGANTLNPAWSDAQAGGEKREQERKEDKREQDKKEQPKGDQDGKDSQNCKNWWECQGSDQQDKKDDQQQDDDKEKSRMMRVDCRYHNEEKIHGINHCYASAIYIPGETSYKHVQLGVGCDFQTIYNDKGRVQIEQVGERISPPTSALPGLEIFPYGALKNTGTYESVLDIRAGRLNGTCYVHPLKERDAHAKYGDQYSFQWNFSALK